MLTMPKAEIMSNQPEQPFQPPVPEYQPEQSTQGQYPQNPQPGQYQADQYQPGTYQGQYQPLPDGQQAQPGYYANPSVAPQAMAYADSRPKNLSIASLVLGIASFIGFGFFLIPQIVGVVLGHLALKREPAGRGMAIAGLVLNYACILIAVLGYIVFFVIFTAAINSTYNG